ncbi:MAG TPA: energy transducer TonB [Gammaproteobacteria bacterium]|nr:energy transducer TonB [Gammaproteobacteria bacterium]
MRKPLLLLTVSALIPAVASAQPEVASESAVESYQMARPAEHATPVYPAAAARDGKEGWVQLNFMISPEGEAYEFQVLDRAGDEAFVRAAQRAAEDTSFSPARMGDRAVDGSLTVTYQFVLENGEKAARRAFADQFRGFVRAMNEGSQDDAAAKLASLEDTEIYNNYEYAHLSLARYQFASRYGSPLEQMRHLETARGENPSQPQYESFLPEDVVTPSRRNLFQLMVQNRNFAEATAVFRLMAFRGDEEGLGLFRETYVRLQAFRTNDAPYAVEGQLDKNGSWALDLFKNDFYLDRITGTVNEIKLRCQREYVFLPFDPETQYTVSESAGNCNIEVLGAPGAAFELVQL